MPTSAEFRAYPTQVLRACLVHAYTALGLPLAFMMLVSAYEGNARNVFLYMLVAFIVDGTDGPLARRFDVKKWTPNFDGRKLDDIVDYLTYVFVPMFFLYRFGLVDGVWTLALLLGLLASGYGFSSLAAKTDDKYFTGFPSYWNAVAFFLYLLKLPVVANGVLVFVLAILVFVPAKYDSTQTMRQWEKWIALPLIVVGTLYLLSVFDAAPMGLVYALLVYPIYHVCVALVAYATGKRT